MALEKLSKGQSETLAQMYADAVAVRLNNQQQKIEAGGMNAESDTVDEEQIAAYRKLIKLFRENGIV